MNRGWVAALFFASIGCGRVEQDSVDHAGPDDASVADVARDEAARTEATDAGDDAASACPHTRPAVGSSCSSTASCFYPGAFCTTDVDTLYCLRGQWTVFEWAHCPTDGGTKEVGAPPDAARTLLDVPVDAGAMAFNEINNTGFSNDFVVRWRTPAMLVSSSGHVTANITTTYDGPAVVADAHRDVLFWHVGARYTIPPVMDSRTDSLSETMGIVATTSDDATASFALNGTFSPPAMSKWSGDLAEVSVELTWVRVYRTAGAIRYHVLPGRVTSSDPAAVVHWDEATAPATARFGYYAPIDASAVGGGDFDYADWCTTHLTW